MEIVEKGAEIIVEPTAWCVPNGLLENATQYWMLMNRAMSLDNMVYFVSSNREGKLIPSAVVVETLLIIAK